MSSDAGPIVSFEHVWKRYRLGGRGRFGVTRRRSLTSEFALALERSGLRRGVERGPSRDHIWALADVSFQVSEGETVGIIGANGSGKSTSLQLISRITQPWAGRVRVRGRVGGLIHIRSGIHPDLTGRENVYLYGSILGLPRRDIKRKFDAIVDFAELGRYIDTPVKRYSAGMEIRLGFSIAVHLDPDILLIDEVLAVGDEAFRRRCIERMDEIHRSGQTIIFVSHELAEIKRLCSRLIYMDRGMIRATGPVDEVIERYLRDVDAAEVQERPGGQQAPTFLTR